MTAPAVFARHNADLLPRSRARVSFVDLAGLAALVIALAIAIPAWARTERGKRAIARQIERALSDSIRGSVTIGRLERVDGDGVAARDVVFVDESGTPVLEALDVELEVDWGELLRGHFVSPRGTVHGGRVWLETSASGELLIDRTFEAPRPGPQDQPIGPDIVRLERLAADHIDVMIRMEGSPGVRASDLSTICLVRAPEHGAARMRADRIDASVRIDAPIPIVLAVEDGTFELDGGARRRAHIVFPSEMGDEAIEMVVNVRADRQERMHVTVDLRPESAGAMIASGSLIAQALLAEGMSDDLDVTVHGP